MGILKITENLFPYTKTNTFHGYTCFTAAYCFRGDFMSKQKKTDIPDDLRINPQQRLCAKFDNVSIAEFPVASRKEMGVRVLDNCAEEHIM